MYRQYAGHWSKMEEMKADMTRLIGERSEEVVRKPPAEGKWTPVQVMEHILTSERATLGYLRKRLEHPERLGKMNWKNRMRSALLYMALRAPVRWKAPEIVAHPPADRPMPEILEEWDRVRTGLKEVLESFPDNLHGKQVFTHPVSGRMSMHQTLRFLSHHLNRHLHQVERMLKA